MKKVIGIVLMLVGLAALGLGLMQIPRISEAEGFVRNAQEDVERQERELAARTAEAKAPATNPRSAADASDAVDRAARTLDDRIAGVRRQKDLVEERQTYLYVFTPAGLVLLGLGFVVFRSGRKES